MNKFGKNVHALFNAGKFEDGDSVPRDHEDLLFFVQDHNLTAQFENIVTLLKLALTFSILLFLLLGLLW